MINIGSKVKFHGQFGFPAEIDVGKAHLDSTTEYTVNFVHTPSPFSTFLFLDGVPGHGFNMAMFNAVQTVDLIV